MLRPHLAPALGLLVLCALPGCARNWTELKGRKTCVVLSAGGPNGLVHLGALAAVRAEAIPIDCVAGTSMGALAGSLYAAAPDRPVAERYRLLLDDYTAATARDTARNAALTGAAGAVVGGVVGGLLGGDDDAGRAAGALIGSLGGLAAGAAAGARLTDPLDHERFVRALEVFFAATPIERLPTPFVTFTQRRTGNGMTIDTIATGSVAQAVGQSIANPFIFPDFDPVRSGYVDPGADRLAATPIDDACRAFPGARLLAINVTGAPSRFDAAMACPLLEVRIDAGAVPGEAMRGHGADFDRLVQLGRDRTRAALAAERRR